MRQLKKQSPMRYHSLWAMIDENSIMERIASQEDFVLLNQWIFSKHKFLKNDQIKILLLTFLLPYLNEFCHWVLYKEQYLSEYLMKLFQSILAGTAALNYALSCWPGAVRGPYKQFHLKWCRLPMPCPTDLQVSLGVEFSLFFIISLQL